MSTIMEVNDVYIDPLGRIWAVKEFDVGYLTLTDPYGLEEDMRLRQSTFRKLLDLGGQFCWKFGWSAADARSWT
jgi:hypothetical protein